MFPNDNSRESERNGCTDSTSAGFISMEISKTEICLMHSPSNSLFFFSPLLAAASGTPSVSRWSVQLSARSPSSSNRQVCLAQALASTGQYYPPQPPPQHPFPPLQRFATHLGNSNPPSMSTMLTPVVKLLVAPKPAANT